MLSFLNESSRFEDTSKMSDLLKLQYRRGWTDWRTPAKDVALRQLKALFVHQNDQGV